MNQFIVSVQKDIPSYPLAADNQAVGEKGKDASVFLEQLTRQLALEDEEQESVIMPDKGQAAEQKELTAFLQAEDWEDVPEVLELLALFQGGNEMREILPIHLTASFGEEPIESVLNAIHTLADVTGIKAPETLQLDPPDEKTMDILVSILQQSMDIADDVLMDRTILEPLQKMLKWSKLMALIGTANGSDTILIESKEKLVNALEQWTEKIPSLFLSSKGAEKVQKPPLDSSSQPYMPRDSNFGLRIGMQEMAVNQTILAKDLQRNDSGTLMVMKNGQPVEANEWARQLEGILAKARFTSLNGLQRLQIRLAPEHLGTLQIEMIKKNGQITASIMANTQQGKEILESHLNHLKMTLSNQGIQMERIILQDSQTVFGEQLKDQQQSREQEQEVPKKEEEIEFSSFLDELQEIVINETV